MLDVHITHIHSGIGADICAVADTLRMLDEFHCFFSGADGCRMIFRINRSQIHGIQQLIRADGGGPHHRLAFCLGLERTFIVLGRQLVQKLF